jgi:hypothetical protein
LGLVVLFVITTDYFVRQRNNRRVAKMVAEETAESPKTAAAEVSA